jgi:tetratricopeptide (TPR) repeat protein
LVLNVVRVAVTCRRRQRVEDDLWRRVEDLCRAQRYQEARTAIDLAPQDGPEPIVLRAYVRAAEGYRREARGQVEELLDTRGDLPAQLLAARFFRYLGDQDATILCAHRASRLAPDNATAWQYLALAYPAGEPKRLAAARRAVALAPDNVDGRLILANMLSRRDVREASEQLTAAARLAPTDPRPQQLEAAARRTKWFIWAIVLCCVGLTTANRLLSHFLNSWGSMRIELACVALIPVIAVGAWLRGAHTRGQSARERLRTKRARAWEETLGNAADLHRYALRSRCLLPLVPMLVLGTHAFAASLGAPLPRWTLVFPIAGGALLGLVGWWLIDWWLGTDAVRQAIRVAPALRWQLALAAALSGVGAVLLTLGVPNAGLWTAAVLALIVWAFGGVFILHSRQPPAVH